MLINKCTVDIMLEGVKDLKLQLLRSAVSPKTTIFFLLTSAERRVGGSC